MRHIGTKPITTERLLLRRFTSDDAQAMFDTWTQDEDVTRYMTWYPHKSIDETRATLQGWVDGYERDDNYHWAIQLKDGTLIGSIGVMKGLEGPEFGDPEGYGPGYCIAKAYWNKGYVSEALKAVVDYFVAGTGCQVLYCAHAHENPASGRVMQKVGFVYHHDSTFKKADGVLVPAKYYIRKT